MDPRTSLGNRLFRHDHAIVANSLRANFSRWRDRLMASLMLVATLAVAHNWAREKSWTSAAWATCAIGVGVALTVRRSLSTRVAYHRFDGVLAADALHRSRHRRYVLAWHGTALSITTTVALIMRPSLILVAPPAYLTGAAMAVALGYLTVPRLSSNQLRSRTIRAWLRRPFAGVAAAVVLLVSLLPAHSLNADFRLAAIGAQALLLTAALTSIDDAIARHRIALGHTPWRIVAAHVPSAFLFAGIASGITWPIAGPALAGSILAGCAAMLALAVLRILAYCAHTKRVADFLVAILLGLLAFTAYSIVFLLPVVGGAALWQLHRRAAANRWLIG